MGLLKAGIGALGGVLADQWKEFFTCDSISSDVLIVKGQKNISSRSSNTKGSDNIITDGSGIVVADGQCMIIVDQGKVVELCAEPGQYTYDAGGEPSLFTGNLSDSLKASFREVGRRFTYGGEPSKDQRVYYFNTKEIIGNMFGTPSPIPFRVIIDERRGIDYEITIRCNGMFSFRVIDPLLLYKNVAGNVEQEYTKEEITPHLKSDFINALQPAFARLSEMGIRYSSIPAHTMELCDILNNVLTKKWTEGRGIAITDVSFNALNAPKEDEDEIQRIKKSIIMSDPMLAGGYQTTGLTDAAQTAAANPNGAVNGFMGMGMVNGLGASNAASLFEQGMKMQNAQPQSVPVSRVNGWNCACGAVNEGKFCTQCGAKKPEDGWKCTCGAVNKGNFCGECGAEKPAGAPLYRCDKCGWKPEDAHNPPKFCPNCGDIFNGSDIN